MDRFKNIKVIGFTAVCVFSLLLAPGISHYIRNHELTVVSLGEKSKEIAALRVDIATRDALNARLKQQNMTMAQRLQAAKLANQQLLRHHIRDLAMQHTHVQVLDVAPTDQLTNMPVHTHAAPTSSSIASHMALIATAHHLARLHNALRMFQLPSNVASGQQTFVQSKARAPRIEQARPHDEKIRKKVAILQVGVFSSVERAQRLKIELVEQGFDAHVRSMVDPNKPLRTKVVVHVVNPSSVAAVKQRLSDRFQINAVMLNL